MRQSMKTNTNKKGQINNLYGYVLILGMIGILLGVVLTVLSKLGNTSGITNKAEDSINDSITALSSITSDWLPVIVVVAVAAIVLYLVMRFGGEGKR